MASSKDTLAIRSEKTDVSALLRASLGPLMAESARDGIELRVDALGHVPEVRVDREKLAWCIATLAGNALRYVKHSQDGRAGGSVLVRLEHDATRPQHIEIAVQ